MDKTLFFNAECEAVSGLDSMWEGRCQQREKGVSIVTYPIFSVDALVLGLLHSSRS
jgi:hypothetical protein